MNFREIFYRKIRTKEQLKKIEHFVIGGGLMVSFIGGVIFGVLIAPIFS